MLKSISSFIKRAFSGDTTNKDSVGLYDPLLAAIGPKGKHPHFRGGYKIWPDADRVNTAKWRLMCIGNSTSLWPDAAWSLELGKLLLAADHSVSIFNGAGKGNSSSQEVMRVLRDVSGIKPDIIVSLSGICDIGYLLNGKGMPFRHKYTRRVLDGAKSAGLISDVVYGYPNELSPAEVWCLNQRLAKAAAEVQGVPLVTFLQAVQGYGTYSQSPEEVAFYATKSPVILKAADKPYGECVIEFYTEVKQIMAATPKTYAHVVDFTEVFADCPGAYRDHRHQSPKGVLHLSQKMMPIVVGALSMIEPNTKSEAKIVGRRK